jgi:hypothetical protein
VFAAFLPAEFNPAKDAGEWHAHHQRAPIRRMRFSSLFQMRFL